MEQITIHLVFLCLDLAQKVTALICSNCRFDNSKLCQIVFLFTPKTFSYSRKYAEIIIFKYCFQLERHTSELQSTATKSISFCIRDDVLH